MNIIAPSILSADFLRLGEQVAACEAAGANWIHIDVMDGQYVPNISMGPMIVEACKSVVSLPLDVHLMIENPDRHIEAFARAGASTITVHVEACTHIHRTLQHIRSLGCQAGIVLNPGTPALSIQPVLNLVDLVLVMSVNPGFSGQAFLPETITKVAEIRGLLNAIHSPAWLQVDGGISSKTIASMREAGATAFVAGSAIFKHPHGIAAGTQALRSALGD